MTRYHFNIKTGNVAVCEAKVRSCPLGEDNHIEGELKDALRLQESRLTETYTGSFTTLEPAEPAVVRGVTKVSKTLKQYTYYPTKEERDALALYTRSGYGGINRYLRNVMPAHPRTLEAIEHLDSLFEKAPERIDAVAVYRLTDNWPDDFNAENIQGNIVNVSTFLSTSSDEKYLTKKNAKGNKKIRWTLTIEPEVKLIDVNAIGESNMVHESEILINRDVELLVNTVTRKNSIYEVSGTVRVKT